jgi:DNA-binding transcriptional LysR family regulator
MEIQWLRYFYEVARHQSVTQAAKSLNVSQPAVSRMIKLVESSFRQPLFRKVGRRLQLTAEGERLYRHSALLFKKWDEILQLESSEPQKLEMTIRIGASDNLALYVFPEVIRRFQQKYPLVNWSIFTGSSREIKQKIFSGELDLGFFYTELGLAERELLQEQVIADVEFLAVAAASPQAPKNIAALKTKSLTYIGVRALDYAHTVPEQWVVKKLKLPINRFIEANSKEVQKRMVLAGMGFGVFPRFMIEKELSAKKLSVIQGTETLLQARLVHRADETLTIVTQNFVKLIKSRL